MKFNPRKAVALPVTVLMLLLVAAGYGSAADYRGYALTLVKDPPASAPPPPEGL